MRTKHSLAATVAACVIGISGASWAGSMTFTMDDFPPVEILGFRTNATTASDFSKVVFAPTEFTANESAASPLQLKLASMGTHASHARLQVMNADATRLVSEWTFEAVSIVSVSVQSGPPDPKAKSPALFLPPVTNFSLTYEKFCYRVFGADGAPATQLCYNIKENKAI